MGTHLNPASHGWYDPLPPFSAQIDCDGARHRITWRDGNLVLEDHDVLAEQSLSALGARPPMCLELLTAWRARRGSELLDELLLSSNTLSPAELAHRRSRHEAEIESAKRMPERMLASFGNQPGRAEKVRLFERQAAERIEREERSWAITLTEIITPGLRRALGLSVIVSLERQWGDDDFRRRHERDLEPALTALATPLFERSARGWSGDLKPYKGFAAKTGLVAAGEQPTCTLWADRSIVHAALSLPLSWFTEVWARGIALVDGYFVMSVVDSSADGVKLRVIAARFERQDWKAMKPLQAPALVTRGYGGDWQLHWV